jgi:predicted nucleic acid-binding protein
MRRIFVDTSALLAILTATERNHTRARAVWLDLLSRGEHLMTTNYVLLETIALVQRRLGFQAIVDFQRDAVPILRVIWIGEDDHTTAVAALLAANRRQLSLVDCASFTAMRRLGLDTVFAFDRHFAEQGFICLPGEDSG